MATVTRMDKKFSIWRRSILLLIPTKSVIAISNIINGNKQTNIIRYIKYTILLTSNCPHCPLLIVVKIIIWMRKMHQKMNIIPIEHRVTNGRLIARKRWTRFVVKINRSIHASTVTYLAVWLNIWGIYGRNLHKAREPIVGSP